jgi:hypothetical protein
MSVKVELLPGEPILLQTPSEDYDYKIDGIPAMDQTLEILDQQTKPVFYIIDMLKMTLSLDDMITAVSQATRQRALFQHPNIIENLFVTQSRMIDLAAKGMNSPIFGNVKIQVFPTVDEALAYARRSLSMRSAG